MNGGGLVDNPHPFEHTIPESILFSFYNLSNVDCWVMCNQEKQPVALHDGFYQIPKTPEEIVPKRYYSGSLLRWKLEPQDNITTLGRVQKIYELSPSYGFGIIIGHGNTLCCFDFDHVIQRDGRIPKKIWRFLEQLATFVEISSSGTGLHAFVYVDGETEEYGFNKEIADGKFYNHRFIKLTGDVFFNFDLPIRTLNNHEYKSIKGILGEACALPKITSARNGTVYTGDKAAYTGDRDCDWETILTDANIRFEIATDYIGRDHKRGSETHTAAWSCRIQCPNITAHTGYEKRLNQFNPDVAILTLWDDGITSVVCNHNHCDGKTYRPNLLLMLWTEIKRRRADIGRKLLIKAGVRL
jgi:hypothetical protein